MSFWQFDNLEAWGHETSQNRGYGFKGETWMISYPLKNALINLSQVLNDNLYVPEP